MSKPKKSTMDVQGTAVTIVTRNQQDLICLTDIARFKNPDHPDDVIRNWLRNRNTVEFLGVWERPTQVLIPSNSTGLGAYQSSCMERALSIPAISP